MTAAFSVLRQPITGHVLREEGEALIAPDGTSYPIKNGIPRFVDAENYADDFGWQWNKFRQTQLDSYTGLSISRDRLTRHLCGHLDKLQGKRVLEAGSGAGRFSEILIEAGAQLCSFDLSNAVEANAKNNPPSDRFVLAQGDIMKIPFERASFDYVICIGVVQHTPDPEATIKSLYEMVKPGGYLVIDHYIANWRWIVPPPIGYAVRVYRKYVLALPRAKRFDAVKKIVDFWFPIHWKFKDSRIMRSILPRFSPTAFYYHMLNLRNQQEYYDWALLDTHDALTDYYKHLRTGPQIEQTLRGMGAEEVAITLAGNGVEAFCRKPISG
ncbi:MAG: methyltransferase domain-containing protein [Alphaproteobacteria bacterium]|nr:methyltransferase domain-containing protein [Alphaproteobacteria bacterium]